MSIREECTIVSDYGVSHKFSVEENELDEISPIVFRHGVSNVLRMNKAQFKTYLKMLVRFDERL